ncbi:unnamed protein product, partial [Mesorhabditis spiculigera]
MVIPHLIWQVIFTFFCFATISGLMYLGITSQMLMPSSVVLSIMLLIPGFFEIWWAYLTYQLAYSFSWLLNRKEAEEEEAVVEEEVVVEVEEEAEVDEEVEVEEAAEVVEEEEEEVEVVEAELEAEDGVEEVAEVGAVVEEEDAEAAGDMAVAAAVGDGDDPGGEEEDGVAATLRPTTVAEAEVDSVWVFSEEVYSTEAIKITEEDNAKVSDNLLL